MRKMLLICVILALTVGCNTKKVPYVTFKREYKENRFTKQFQEADSMFIMDAKTLFTKVVQMRKAQKEYFKCRTQANLRICKALEAEIDREIERVNSIIPPPKQPEQKNLFTD